MFVQTIFPHATLFAQTQHTSFYREIGTTKLERLTYWEKDSSRFVIILLMRAVVIIWKKLICEAPVIESGHPWGRVYSLETRPTVLIRHGRSVWRINHPDTSVTVTLFNCCGVFVFFPGITNQNPGSEQQIFEYICQSWQKNFFLSWEFNYHRSLVLSKFCPVFNILLIIYLSICRLTL